MAILNWDLSVVLKGIHVSDSEMSKTCRLLKLCLLVYDALKLSELFTRWSRKLYFLEKEQGERPNFPGWKPTSEVESSKVMVVLRRLQFISFLCQLEP